MQLAWGVLILAAVLVVAALARRPSEGMLVASPDDRHARDLHLQNWRSACRAMAPSLTPFRESGGWCWCECPSGHTSGMISERGANFATSGRLCRCPCL